MQDFRGWDEFAFTAALLIAYKRIRRANDKAARETLVALLWEASIPATADMAIRDERGEP